MDWVLYILIFVFGYVTCRLVYFFRVNRLSLSLLKLSHIIYLSTLIKAMEHLSYAREIMLEHMLKSEKGPTHISSFEYRFEEDVRHLKERSIRELVQQHPEIFRQVIDFEDWPTAMRFLMENRAHTLTFWNKSNDRQD